MTAVVVKHVTMRAAGPADQATGVIGFVTATINGLIIDGLTIRQTLTGERRVGFPRHEDAYGQVFPTVRPEDDAMRREITRQILAALWLDGAATDRHGPQGDSRNVDTP